MKLNELLTIWLMLIFCIVPSFANADSVGVITQPGSYLSKPSGGCSATLSTSPQGGFLQLSIGRDSSHLARIADDVTAIAWVDSGVLIYSVSPIYGKPGVFVVKCGSEHQISTLVSPRHVDKGYPDGADYFEIHAIDGNKVSYYYAPDVDKLDLKKLRSNENLRTVKLPNSE